MLTRRIILRARRDISIGEGRRDGPPQQVLRDWCSQDDFNFLSNSLVQELEEILF
jgi:hypothetical protein